MEGRSKMDELKRKVYSGLADINDYFSSHTTIRRTFGGEESFCDCQGYKDIIETGYSALPVLKKLYDWRFCAQGAFGDAEILVNIVLDIIKNDIEVPKSLKSIEEIGDYIFERLEILEASIK